MDAASGATFRTLRASAAHTGRRPACPQGLEEAGWYAERGLCVRRVGAWWARSWRSNFESQGLQVVLAGSLNCR